MSDDDTPAPRSRPGRPTSARRRARDVARDPDEQTTDGPGDQDTAPAEPATVADGPTTPPVPSQPAAIETTQLTKVYGGATALAPLDLRIEYGDRISLIGHNGSGKTTLLRLFAGLLEPSAGTATIGGAPTGSPDARGALSYLSDQPVFYDDLTVWEHLEFVARMHRTDDWEDHARHLVEALGLESRVDDLPATFSRGLKQKTSIAIALVRPFEVLLVDEPFVGLDRSGREALLELLSWAHADGATLLVATHELANATTSDRLVALADGEVIFDGDPADADVAALADGIAPAP